MVGALKAELPGATRRVRLRVGQSPRRHLRIGEGDRRHRGQIEPGVAARHVDRSARASRGCDVHELWPIGVAFVDPAGTPGWIGDNPDLRIHAPSIRGCRPVVRGLDLE